MERMLQLGAEALEISQSSSASLSPPDVGKTTMQNNRINSEDDIPQAPVRRSLLGDLPSLQPPIAQTRKAGAKAVEFTDPLHSSIPRACHNIDLNYFTFIFTFSERSFEFC